MFQRFAFWESRKRRDFWQDNPPHRIYICGDRLAAIGTTWRRTSDKKAPQPAQAFFVYERGHPPGIWVVHIYKDAVGVTAR